MGILVTTTSAVVHVNSEMPTVIATQSTASATITVGQTGPQGPMAPKTLTVLEPFAGDSYTLVYSAGEKTISSISTGILGSGGSSVTYEIKQASDRTTAGSDIVAPSVTSSIGTVTTPTLSTATIAEGNFVWLNVLATTGVVDEFHLTLEFT